MTTQIENDTPNTEQDVTDADIPAEQIEGQGTDAQQSETAEPAQETEQGNAEGEQPQQKPAPRKASERIDELTRARREAEREAAYWRGIAQGSSKAPSEEKPDAPKAKPTPDQFDTYDKYIEAFTDWKADQKIAEAEARRAEAERARQQQEHLQQASATFAQRVAEFRAQAPDFDDVVASVADVQVSDALRDLILGSEAGPQIVYELAKDPAEAQRISSLPPVLAAREIGRLESRLMSQPAEKPAAPAAPAKPTVTKAPPPIQPNRNATGQFSKDEAAMTDAEWWAAQRNKS